MVNWQCAQLLGVDLYQKQQTCLYTYRFVHVHLSVHHVGCVDLNVILNVDLNVILSMSICPSCRLRRFECNIELIPRLVHSTASITLPAMSSVHCMIDVFYFDEVIYQQVCYFVATGHII